MVEMRLLVLKIIQQRLLPKQSLKGVLLQENKKQIQRDCWKVKEFSYREFKMSIKTARERWPNAICMINISKAYLIPDCNHGFWGCPFKSKENWSWSETLSLKFFGILLLVGRSLGRKVIRECLANRRNKGVIYEAECRVMLRCWWLSFEMWHQ